MSYIQVTLGDKPRGLKFNILALKLFNDTVDYNRFNETANYAMVYAGLYANCFVKREEPDFTFEDVVEWVDQLSQKEVDDISLVMASLDAFKKMLPQSEEPAKEETAEEKKSELKSMPEPV